MVGTKIECYNCLTTTGSMSWISFSPKYNSPSTQYIYVDIKVSPMPYICSRYLSASLLIRSKAFSLYLDIYYCMGYKYVPGNFMTKVHVDTQGYTEGGGCWEYTLFGSEDGVFHI